MARSQIAEQLREAREAAGLTQREAADLLGVVAMTISKRERGVINISATDFAEAIAAYEEVAERGHSRLSPAVPRGTNLGAVSERRGRYAVDSAMDARLKSFERELVRAQIDDATVDYAMFILRLPETVSFLSRDPGDDMRWTKRLETFRTFLLSDVAETPLNAKVAPAEMATLVPKGTRPEDAIAQRAAAESAVPPKKKPKRQRVGGT